MLDKEKLEEVDVSFLKPGTILAGTIFDENGVMLWPAKKQLTDNFIATLKVNNIKKIYYVPPKYKNISEKEPIFSEQTFNAAYQALDEIIHQIKFNKIPETTLVKNIIEKFRSELESRPNGFLNLMVLKDYDSYTYTHSINVGILSMFLTKKLGFNNYFVLEMGIGGFLHDIGKLKVPNKIVNKNGTLTEEEYRIMKNHPIYGFNLIKDDKTLSNYVKKVVLFHHEKWDGTGYPLKLKGEAIGNFANIVSVCDVYDALTTERSYKKPYSVNDALIYIMRNTLIHFSPFVSQRFINEMAIMYDLGSFYPVGAFVLLNTGEVGYITKKDNEYTLKPEIVIIKNSKSFPLRNPIQIDLKRDTSRVISKTIDDPDEIERLKLLL